MQFLDELRWRGLIHQHTPGVDELLKNGPITGYCGFDPTATSMTIGNFVPILLLMRLQRAGHKPLALVGGATGLIGDPSGKSTERKLLDQDSLNNNIASFKNQLSKYLDFSPGAYQAELVNNYDWFKSMDVFTFLRDIGKHITVNYMLSKDSVQTRMENGISFTEFSYQLIQGYDYYWLWKNKGCRLQLAGSDQWGNMTTGLELIRRMEGGEAHLLTCPLITKADGTKFGKTEDGALWIDKNLTSPYQFYQYWINASDEDVKKYIRMLTFLDETSILEMEAEQAKDPSQRILQKALGKEVTSIVHSDEDYRAAMSTSDLMFGKPTPDTLKNIANDQWENVFRGIPTFKIDRSVIENGAPILNILAELTSIFPSKGEARKMLSGGGIALNLEKISSVDMNINTDQLIQNKYMVIQKGKKNYHLIIVE